MKNIRNLFSSVGYPTTPSQYACSLASAKAHLKLARLSESRAKAHRVLLSLRENEACIHAYLYAICQESAAERETIKKHPARILRRFGREHLKLQLVARKAAWAHRKMSAHSVANAIWHINCTNRLRSQIRVQP